MFDRKFILYFNISLFKLTFIIKKAPPYTFIVSEKVLLFH